MTGAELEARLRSAGIAASVEISDRRAAYEVEEGAFDTLTLHLSDGSIAIGGVGENAYDVWLEANHAPEKAAASGIIPPTTGSRFDLIRLYDADREKLREAGKLLDQLDAGDGVVGDLERVTYLGGYLAGLADRESVDR